MKLLKQDCQLGEIYGQTNRRFNSFEKRLDADVELKSRYKIFIDGNWAYGGDSSERDTKQKLLPAPPLHI